MATMAKETNLPNGPAAAALLAGGIGSAVMGVLTLLVEYNTKGPFATAMTWTKPVGPLSGKSGLAIIAFLVSWAVLHFLWKDKETNFNQIAMIALILLVIGLVLTFPLVWPLLGA
jgi:hypothetical protein